MQMLYPAEIGKQPPDQVRTNFWKAADEVGPDVRDFAEELFRVAVGPDDRESADEMRRERRPSAALLEFALDAIHGRAEIPVLAAPARRIHARGAVERIDAKPGIVGEGGEPRSLDRRPRL